MRVEQLMKQTRCVPTHMRISVLPPSDICFASRKKEKNIGSSEKKNKSENKMNKNNRTRMDSNQILTMTFSVFSLIFIYQRRAHWASGSRERLSASALFYSQRRTEMSSFFLSLKQKNARIRRVFGICFSSRRIDVCHSIFLSWKQRTEKMEDKKLRYSLY